METDSQKYNDRIELWQLISWYLDRLGWSPAFLAKKASILESGLSHLKRGDRGLSPEKCTCIYKVFKAVKMSGFTFDAPELCLSREMGANLHLKETPVDLLHKKVRVENGGHLTREKRTTWRIPEPL